MNPAAPMAPDSKGFQLEKVMMAGKRESEKLARWAAECPCLEDIALIHLARDAVVDIVACMTAGSQNREVRLLGEAMAEWGRGGGNVVFGRKERFHTPWAALLNGAAAHALDFDDNFLPAFTHATAVLIPALLSVAEAENLSGLDFLDAYIIGLELHTRIGAIVNPEHFQKGWHSTATVGTIGTAGACARLLGLDADAGLNAMSIGFSLAAGSKKQFGTMMKPIHAGLAAQHGVMAAKMASAGISGNDEFLTGPWSFQELYGGPDMTRSDIALQNLGMGSCLQQYGLIVKRFPCCASAHKTLDGLLELMENYSLDASKIKHITARLPETLSRNLPFGRPQNEMEARFSLPYAAARIIIEGHLSLQHFTKEAVNDFAKSDLIERVHIETIPDPEELSLKTPIYSSIELKDGTLLETGVTDLKGSKSNPLSELDLEKKFIDCLDFVGKKESAEDLFQTAKSVAYLENVSSFTEKIHQLFIEQRQDELLE